MATQPKYKNTDGYKVNGDPLDRSQRVKDTLVPSRRLMALVNDDESFVLAQRHLSIFPQKLYLLIQESGIARVKQCSDFILSIVMETPSFFYVDRQGKYDPSSEGVKTRARNLLISLCMDPRRPLLEKYAGASYFKKWKKETV